MAKKPKNITPKPALKLDLGSGPRPAEGFKGVDVVPGVTDFCVNLCSGQRWLWDDDSVSELRSSHFIEHIDADYVRTPERARMDALLWFFDEAYRVAKHDAVFTVQWPALQSVRAFQDPTHRRFVPAETILYLSREGRTAMGVDHYGATCNWVGTVVPTIAESPEDQLRNDEWRQKEQGRRYRETWNFSQDFIATLRAVKS